MASSDTIAGLILIGALGVGGYYLYSNQEPVEELDDDNGGAAPPAPSPKLGAITKPGCGANLKKKIDDALSSQPGTLITKYVNIHAKCPSSGECQYGKGIALYDNPKEGKSPIQLIHYSECGTNTIGGSIEKINENMWSKRYTLSGQWDSFEKYMKKYEKEGEGDWINPVKMVKVSHSDLPSHMKKGELKIDDPSGNAPSFNVEWYLDGNVSSYTNLYPKEKTKAEIVSEIKDMFFQTAILDFTIKVPEGYGNLDCSQPQSDYDTCESKFCASPLPYPFTRVRTRSNGEISGRFYISKRQMGQTTNEGDIIYGDANQALSTLTFNDLFCAAGGLRADYGKVVYSGTLAQNFKTGYGYGVWYPDLTGDSNADINEVGYTRRYVDITKHNLEYLWVACNKVSKGGRYAKDLSSNIPASKFYKTNITRPLNFDENTGMNSDTTSVTEQQAHNLVNQYCFNNPPDRAGDCPSSTFNCPTIVYTEDIMSSTGNPAKEWVNNSTTSVKLKFCSGKAYVNGVEVSAAQGDEYMRWLESSYPLKDEGPSVCGNYTEKKYDWVCPNNTVKEGDTVQMSYKGSVGGTSQVIGAWEQQHPELLNLCGGWKNVDYDCCDDKYGLSSQIACLQNGPAKLVNLPYNTPLEQVKDKCKSQYLGGTSGGSTLPGFGGGMVAGAESFAADELIQTFITSFL